MDPANVDGAKPPQTRRQKRTKQLCAAMCHRRWGMGELRSRGILTRMDECGGHILCWECTGSLVAWAERNKVKYFRCPLCRVEVYGVLRDGGGRSRAHWSVQQLIDQRRTATTAAAARRAAHRKEQRSVQDAAMAAAGFAPVEAAVRAHAAATGGDERSVLAGFMRAVAAACEPGRTFRTPPGCNLIHGDAMRGERGLPPEWTELACAVRAGGHHAERFVRARANELGGVVSGRL